MTTYVNQAFSELTGCADAKSANEVWLPSLSLSTRDKFARLWADALVTRAPFRFEFEGHRASGEPCSLYGQWILDTCDVLYGAITDVTALHRIERERLDAVSLSEQLQRQRAEEAEEHRRSQEIFVDTICHEIRNPLNGILNNVDLLRTSLLERRSILATLPLSQLENDSITDVHRVELACMHAIETCANHQRLITNDVLNYSRLKANKLALQVSPFRLDELINTAMLMFATESATLGIALVQEVRFW